MSHERRGAVPVAPTTDSANYEAVMALYCALLSGTTERRPWRTSGESAKRELALICDRETGLARALAACIFTCGFLGSVASTETTVAVPPALLSSPVW